MNLLFWKRKKAPDEDGAAPEEPSRVEDDAPPPKPDLVARLKGALVWGIRKFKRKPPAPDTKEEVEDQPPARLRNRRDAPEESGETGDEVPTRSGNKKRLLLIALLILLLAGIGIAAWKLWPAHENAQSPEPAAAAEPTPAPAPAEPTPQQETSPAGTAAVSQDEAQPFSAPIAPASGDLPIAEAGTPETAPPSEGPADGDIQAQIAALKKQNQEMQAQIEALKQQSGSASSTPARSGSAPLPKEGVLIIGGKNNKENAQSLKKVIEEMNATSDKSAPPKK